MKFDVIGGGALPELEIRLVHSEKKARKVIRRLEGREYEEDWKSLVGRQAHDLVPPSPRQRGDHLPRVDDSVHRLRRRSRRVAARP